MSDAVWTKELKEFADIGPRKSLAEEAADTLREFILLGKLPPGEPVPERDLAEALGISRTPLKEALRILEVEGLITYGPGPENSCDGINERRGRSNIDNSYSSKRPGTSSPGPSASTSALPPNPRTTRATPTKFNRIIFKPHA